MGNKLNTPQMNRRALLLGAAAGLATLPLSARKLLAADITPGPNAVLLVIDVQNCFLPGGTLPVTDGHAVIPLINELSKKFKSVVLTQDWHTAGHASFASSYEGKEPFDTTELSYGTQVLWPDHCVQGTEDAKLAATLDIPHAQMIVRKGFRPDVDSYSAFMEADGVLRTGLTSYLQELGLTEVYVCGLATDFCVSWSAQDAKEAGFNVSVIEDATRAIDLNGSLSAAWSEMNAAGVHRIQSAAFM
jgi:nicotinamidase/pyrazinamidase